MNEARQPAPHSLAGLSLRDLEYAVVVAELRHFGRAAEHCGVSQPTLSEQIRKLEALLGIVLFERQSRRVAVTPRGETFLEQARLLLRQARGLLDLARQQAEPLSGPLRLGVIATLGPYYIPSVLRQVRQRFPKLVLRLQEGRTAGLVAALGQGELDAVLLSPPAPGENLASAPLFFEPFLLAFPAGHRLQQEPCPGLADLAGTELLLLEEGHCLRDQALAFCQAARSHGEERFASSLEMLRHMIAAGEGYSLLPRLAVENRGDLQDLIGCRPLAEAIGRDIALVWRATDPRRPEFEMLAAFLRQVSPLPPQAAAADPARA